MSGPNDVDYREERQKWMKRLTAPVGQALIRYACRDEVMAHIPKDLEDYITVEDYENMLLVKVHGKAEVVTWLQTLCDMDCACMNAQRASEEAAEDPPA